jgi:hypothetical protein
MDHGDDAQDEISAARSLIEEMAGTVPDKELKQNFRQRASEAL